MPRPRTVDGGELVARTLKEFGVEVAFGLHATVQQTGNIISADGAPTRGFVFRDNITFHNTYGVVGSGQQPGNHALQTFLPGAVFTNNVLIGPYPTAGGVDPSLYSDFPGNFFPNSVAEVGFVNAAGGDFSLAPGSPYKGMRRLRDCNTNSPRSKVGFSGHWTR